MGARSSPEGYRVAAGRYGLPVRTRAQPVRWAWIAGVLLASVIVTACSHVSGSKSSNSGRPPACAFVAKLDEIANTVAHAKVQDPDAFGKTLSTAVRDYVQNVRDLRAVAPEDLRAGLVRVEADVQQLRFDAALTDRAELDAYAARACGRVASAPTTSLPGTGPSSTAPAPETTVAAGPTTTVPAPGG